jgi:transposase-like protein
MAPVLELIPQDRWASISTVRTVVAMNALMERHFQTAEAAREWLERIRWPKGPICPHCGTFDHAYAIRKVGWYRCAEKECRKDFSVTLGTVTERSHIALNEWLAAFYLVCSSKKRISTHQLRRALDLDYKSAWFLAHRIRRAMRVAGLLHGAESPPGILILH